MSRVLITGANRGIGLELCKQASQRGDHVIAVCRSVSPELQSLGVDIERDVDVTDESAVKNLGSRLEGVTLDVLINNAGVLTRESLEDLNFDRMRLQFEINSLGPLRMTHALLDNLIHGSKVVIITSRMGSIGDNTSGSRYGYRMSKAAVNIAGVSLCHDLRPRGIAVAILHPGLVATQMTGGHGIPAAQSADGLWARIDALTLESSGGFWHANGERLPW